ncbi:MAG TPA: hypothetical protein VMJ64_05130 [Anaerolineales bacterium]|nr:hypothetical protein [Anaerolineales bacterium]
MHTITIYKYVLSALLLASLAACGSIPAFGQVTPSGSSGAASSPSTDGQAPAADLCANPLVPVKQGAIWSYVNTGVSSSPITLSTTITDVKPDGFTVATHFDDSITLDQDWACTPDGLLARSLGSGQTTLGLSLSDVTASFATSNAAGVTLPAHVKQGKTWMYGLDVMGNIVRDNLSAELRGTVSTNLQELGTENVTVPAGTFSAMKISAVTTFNMNANYSGITIPISSSVNSTFWFAPGVGWVKSVQTGDLPGMAINSVTELQSYKLP